MHKWVGVRYGSQMKNKVGMSFDGWHRNPCKDKYHFMSGREDLRRNEKKDVSKFKF